MPSFLRRYATPLVTGLFLVSLVSGVLLFFHLGGRAFHGMHEWLSMVLILPFALHLWRNWRSMTGYFRHAPMAVALGASLLLAAVFFLPSGGETRAGRPAPPQFALADAIMRSPMMEVAPILDTPTDTLVARLTDAGFDASDPSQSLSGIADAAGRDPADLMRALVAGESGETRLGGG